MAISVVILAAGQGKRMHSTLPKVLHCLAGKPLLEHVVNTASQLNDQKTIVIYGHQGDTIRNELAKLPVEWVFQDKQLGTGHAVMQALPHTKPNSRVLILYGDVPLISLHTLAQLIAKTPNDALGIITARVPNPFGLGRIIRNEENEITAIIEEKDATDNQRAITEINTGIYIVPEKYLQKWLPQLKNKNSQQEFYLTDIIKFAVTDQVPIIGHSPIDYTETLGVNDCAQLAFLERIYQRQRAEKLMQQGVTLYDPNRLDVRGELSVGHDVVFDINVIIEGQVTIGNYCKIGANSILRNVTLGDHVEIKANSIIDGAEIGNHCIIGPFARIRPDTVLSTHVHIGNFVEIKKSRIDTESKVNHLTYIGDSDIGKSVNIGAGTITCNYDGANKHKTTIGDRVFIGSNASLVAPITIAHDATIGAGSVITRNAPAEQLTLTRAEQRSISSWVRPKKKVKE